MSRAEWNVNGKFVNFKMFLTVTKVSLGKGIKPFLLNVTGNSSRKYLCYKCDLCGFAVLCIVVLKRDAI